MTLRFTYTVTNVAPAERVEQHRGVSVVIFRGTHAIALATRETQADALQCAMKRANLRFVGADVEHYRSGLGWTRAILAPQEGT